MINNVVSIKYDPQNWFKCPDSHIKFWDKEGNIEWINMHPKMLRRKPKKGLKFEYNVDRFIEYDNLIINKEYIGLFIKDTNLNTNIEEVNQEIEPIILNDNNLIKIDDLTILIKSFMRPDSVINLIDSIKARYDIKIIIIDDSNPHLNFDSNNVKTYNIKFDSGLSAGRNYGLGKIKTPYFLLCDDDFEFTDNTNLSKWLEILKNSDLDILGADVIMNGKPIDYFGLLKIINGSLYYVNGNHGSNDYYTEYDLILNFFIAKTESIRNNNWDDELKIAEHTAFFLKNKGVLKIAHTKMFSINHQQIRNHEYNVYRSRAKDFFKNWMRKNNIKEVINFKGEKTKI